tara:strand:- start:3 stop:140 length:138 start_codon:yes stop_codon:yes gene_type:complete
VVYFLVVVVVEKDWLQEVPLMVVQVVVVKVVLDHLHQVLDKQEQE